MHNAYIKTKIYENLKICSLGNKLHRQLIEILTSIMIKTGKTSDKTRFFASKVTFKSFFFFCRKSGQKNATLHRTFLTKQLTYFSLMKICIGYMGYITWSFYSRIILYVDTASCKLPSYKLIIIYRGVAEGDVECVVSVHTFASAISERPSVRPSHNAS